jgi:iron-sulfur cluster assembly accessory protein
VVTDGTSFRYLKGLSIDYTTDLVKAGFRFLNPNAVSSCGCGSSFAVQGEASG